MNGYLYGLFLLVSFGASIAGAVCGIGGGIIIKPALDIFGVLSVSAVSFLSGCTVLAMTCYSVIKWKVSGESLVEKRTGTPLAIGAALGGVTGKSMFQAVSSLFAEGDRVGAVQAACLLVITLGTLIYTVKKDRIHTYHVTDPLVCMGIGLVLGIFSSFLGIGGGPINLVVLFFFFSMNTKAAAQNSLYIILFSQITSLIHSLTSGTVPEFSVWLLALMVTGGILGGMGGCAIHKIIDEEVTEKLFLFLMAVIIGINIYNIYQFI